MKFFLLNVIFLLAAIIVFITIDNIKFAFVILSIAIIVYIFLLSLFSFWFSLNFFLRGIHKGKKGTLAITFDDGPHEIYTPAILETLKKYKVPAAFFVIGKKCEAHPDIIKRISAEGHELGNHTYSHSTWNGFFSAHSEVKEIEKTNAVIKTITGMNVKIFRPPFGVTNPNIAGAVSETGITAVGWDLRAYDTIISNEQRLLKRIIKRLPNATILLLHDTQPATVKILAQILDFCQSKGISIIPLTKAIKH